MSLIERDEQLACLDRLLADSMTRKGQVVLLTGPAGSGKTELLRVFAESAANSGVIFLNATCYRPERGLPWGMVNQLLHSAPLPESVMARAAELLAEATAEPDDPNTVRALHGLCLLLLDLAADSPILLGIDDVEHADALSLQCLLQLSRRASTARILTVLTDTPDGHSSLRAELIRQPAFHRIDIAPLSEAAVTQLAVQHLDSAELGPELHAASGGNPLLVHALIEDYQAAEDVRAQGYGLAFLSAVHRSETVVSQTVHAVAVLSEGAPRDELAELAELDVDAVAQSLDALNAAGLLDEDRFRHPVARQAVLDDIAQPERQRLHRRAARMLHDRGAPALAIARHLIEADLDGDRWAVDVLLEAGEQARLAHQPQLAATCFQLAYRSSSDELNRAGIRARLARAEWRINPSAAARHLAPLAEAMRAHHLTRRDSIVLARQLLWHGRVDEAVDVLDRIRGAVGDQQLTEAAAELRDTEMWLTCTYPPLARRRQVPAVLAQQKTALVTPKTDPWLQAAAKFADALTRGQVQEATEDAEQVLRDLHLTRNTSWAEECAMLALLVLTCADKIDTATEWCDRLLAEANIREAVSWQAMFSSARAEIAVRQGDLAAAVRFANDAITALPPKMWGVAIGFPLGSLILACTRMGDYESAAKHLTVSIDDAMFKSRYGLHYLYARGHYYLATNHFHAALADFLACGELMRGWGLDVAGLVPWRTSAAEAWLRLGNADQARRLVYDQLGRPGVDGTRIRGLSLRQLAAASPANRRPQLLTEALELFEDCGDRFEQARSLADLSRAYHALDENRRARMVFRRAWHVAKLCEAEPLCQELLAVTTDLTGTNTVTGNVEEITSLTGSERRVASLAVMGYTNREIAAKLYITASTVEQHLTRVYKKLNVKRRKDLPVDLSQLSSAG